jgi:hypothetical protein
MRRPAYWLMSDPLANPQFRRDWTHPPPLRRRHPAPLAGDARVELAKRLSEDATATRITTPEEARLAAEALFVPGRLTKQVGEALDA